MRNPIDRSPEFATPAGGLPCIWMSAGLVAYKLCDRGFECDGCPFDQAMRGGTAAPARRGRRDAVGYPAFGVARPAGAAPRIDAGADGDPVPWRFDPPSA